MASRTTHYSWLIALSVLCCLADAEPAAAQAVAPQTQTLHVGPVPSTYALLIGSNPGGAGQATLRYAHDDARRMAQVLTDLGRFPEAKTRVLLGPNKQAVLGALDDIGRQLAAHRARGEQAQLVFYYSGHARSSAIHLGHEELALTELRERILQLPTTLTLIVLDACQSGAISRVKGAEPAAEFSYNSVSRLQTAGVAVMASSTSSELSQESEALRGSYFTHHLMVGLRGAGDVDANGIVSLAEAYRYAYEHTLSATARTAVGEQHVTLETSLTGQGDVPITYPAEAAAQLELPAELQAEVFVERDGSVLAELHKAQGHALRLALPAGELTVVLRRGTQLSQCALTLRDGQVTRVVAASCQAISDAQARAKGYAAITDEAREAPLAPREEWGFELTLGLGGFTHDDYTQRLEDFGFAEQIGASGSPLRLQAAVSRQFMPHLSLVADLRNFDAGHYQRDLQSTPDAEVFEHFDWSSFALSAHVRAHADAFGAALRFYAQLGVGLGLGTTKLEDFEELYAGPVLSGSAGIFYMPWRNFGFIFQGTYAYAPIIGNEISETHDSGGIALSVGLRIRTWSEP